MVTPSHDGKGWDPTVNRSSLEAMNLNLKEYFIALLMMALPSPLKVGLMKLAGAKIGKKVRIGFGSVVMADSFKDVEIGDYSFVRNFTIIICREVKLGRHTQVAMKNWIWGSGRLVCGDKCYFGAECRIDLRTNDLVMGEHSGFTTGCMVYTHTHFNSYVLGFMHRSAPVRMGNNVFVGLRTIILPGVNLADNVVVGAASVVTRDIPTNSFACGDPCRVVGEYGKFIDKVDDGEAHRRVTKVGEDMVDFFGFKKVTSRNTGNTRVIGFEKQGWGGKGWHLVVTDAEGLKREGDHSSLNCKKTVLFSSDRVPDETRKHFPLWFDLRNQECGSLLDPFARDIWNFLRDTWVIICDDED